MDLLLSYFSPYEIKARFFPAIIVLAPLLFTILIWYPNLISLESSIITIIIFIIILFFMARISREMGFKKQQKLIKDWGGLPSTILLRHRDTVIDAISKKRYHSFLKSNVSGITIPTPEEEIKEPEFYDAHYTSAGKWLLENTRDSKKYSLLYQDNISYGFSRNMLGIKPLGIISSIVALFINIFGLYQEYEFIVSNFPLKIWLSLLIDIIFLCSFLFFVKESWVKSTSEAYARTLLASCEKIN